MGAGGEREPNRNPASECHQIRFQEVEGQKCSTCRPGSRTPHLYAPAKSRPKKLWGVGWRMRGQRLLCKMCTLLQYGWGGVAEHWPSNVACRAARGPSQRANAGQYMRGGSGGRRVCKSHMLSPCKAAIEVDRDGEKGEVMLMSQLMEMSCQDCVGLRSRRSWRIRPKLQWWHRSFRPCLQKRCSI